MIEYVAILSHSGLYVLYIFIYLYFTPQDSSKKKKACFVHYFLVNYQFKSMDQAPYNSMQAAYYESAKIKTTKIK
jgi:hypothetical protein